MAPPSLRLFPVTVLAVVAVVAVVVSSAEEHEWHFNPGRRSEQQLRFTVNHELEFFSLFPPF